MRCMVAGGGINLKATRSLTLIENRPLPEAYSVRPQELTYFREAGAYIVGVEEQSQKGATYAIALLIDVLPANCLHTFR